MVFMFKPMPKNFNSEQIFAQLNHLVNIEGLFPHLPTPQAAVTLLKSSKVSLEGKTAVILGRSEIVGKPLIHLLLDENLTVCVCHSKTPKDKMIQLTKAADIVFACVGKPAFVKKEWIKPGAIVIDIGTNEMDGRIVGDVEDNVKTVAGFISPVPGGVGPVTSVMLMKNVVEAFKCHIS